MITPIPKPVRQKKDKRKVVKLGKIAKPKKKIKKDSIPKNIRERTLSDMQKLRKMQESFNGKCVCISCGKILELGSADCQGGHYITRQNRATEIEPDNIFPQCAGCNGYKHGNVVAYRFNLVNKIGEERVKRLETMALAREGNQDALALLSPKDRETCTYKRTKKDYQALDTKIRQEIKALEQIL